MTLPVKELKHVLSVAAEYRRETEDYRKADLVGINMEGPFISHGIKTSGKTAWVCPQEAHFTLGICNISVFM